MKKAAPRSKSKKSAPKKSAPRRTSVKKTAKKAAKALPDFRELIDNASHGVLIHSNFKPLFANQSFAHLFGYKSAKEIMAMPLIRPLVPPDHWARIEDEYTELIRGRREPSLLRVRGIRKDKKELWVAILERVIEWEGKTAVAISAFDITAQMINEQALMENEQTLRSILEILPYPIYITRPASGQVLFVNRKTCLLFQQSAGHLLRSKSIDFFASAKEREDLRQLLSTVRDIRDIEAQMKTSSGREFPAEIAAIAMVYDGAPAILVALNDISQRKEMEAELFSQATTDELTGISNRRHFFMQAERELNRAKRFGRPLATMMLDLDYFKSINDNHGHAVGDEVLQGFVKRALESLRVSDIIGRLGGEEFAVIMPETSLEAAEAAAERLRAHLAERPLIAGRTALEVTVSVGVASYGEEDKTIDVFLNRADKALYVAKNGGRNKVEVAK